MTGDRLTVGVVTPHAAAGPEVELPAMTRGRVATVVSRTGPPPEAARAPSRTAPPLTPSCAPRPRPAALDRAAATFRAAALAAVVHASTTTGYVIGRREEAELVERLAQRFDVPAVASCAAAVAALRAHGVERVQLVHPPWFDDEFDELGEAYFRSHGFDAVVTRAVGLPEDPADVDPHAVVDWVERPRRRPGGGDLPRRQRVPCRAGDRGAGAAHGPARPRGQPGACCGGSWRRPGRTGTSAVTVVCCARQAQVTAFN